MTGRSRQYCYLINIRSNIYIYIYAIVYFLVLIIYSLVTNVYIHGKFNLNILSISFNFILIKIQYVLVFFYTF